MNRNIIPYGAIFLTSLALSIGGVWCAAHVDQLTPEDGGRGGALAVAISFAALFVGRAHDTFQIATEELEKLNAAVDQYKSLLERKPLDTNSAAIETIFERLKIYLDERIKILVKTDAHDQGFQNWFLAASSVIGTLFWGFGDWFVYWIKAGKFFFPPS